MANFYFLIMFLLELVPAVADGGAYSTAMALGFVVLLSMLKDAYEDIKRAMSDNRENNGRV